MKKTLSILLASAVMSAGMTAALAADEEKVTVIVDGREIAFDDQAAVIVDDRTLVPARGVFNAMGCDVTWFEEEERVVIDSKDNRTRIAMNIGDDVLRVYTFTTVVDMEREDVQLDTAPQLINDRTMLPLRAISESLSASVDWDEATSTVTITTLSELDTQALPKLYITADKTECAEGDTVTVSLFADKLSQLGTDITLVAVTAAVAYDLSAFDYSEITYFPENPEYANMGASNPKYLNEAVKYAEVVNDMPINSEQPVELARITFTAKAAAEASFAISNKYDTRIGSATMLEFSGPTGRKALTLDTPDNIFIDTTPVTVSVKADDEDKTDETADGADDENTEDNSTADASDNATDADSAADADTAADADANTDINGSEIVENVEDTEAEDAGAEDADSESAVEE